MQIDREMLTRLVDAIIATTDEEIDCEEWLARVATLLETVARGEDVPAHLQPIVQHIEVCPTCAEEYHMLLETLIDRSSQP